MANLGDRRRGSGDGGRTAEKFVPASAWTQDDKGHYLFVDLPGFKKEELRLELASTGHIVISGERTVNENKSIYFHQTFPLPENSDMDKISGKFDGDFLHVTVPKRSSSVAAENSNISNGEIKSSAEAEAEAETEAEAEEANNNYSENQSKHEEEHGDGEQHCGNEEKGEIRKETYRLAGFPLEMAMKFLKNNKGAVLSVVVAFMIGMLVCRISESRAEE